MAPNQSEVRDALRILLIDASPLRRASLSLLLGSWTEEEGRGFEVAEAVPSADQLRSPAGAHLALLSVGAASASTPEVAGAIAELGRRVPDAPIVVLSDKESAADVVSAIRAGARGFITAHMDPRAMFRALKFIGCGGTFFPSTALLDGLDDTGSADRKILAGAPVAQRGWTGGIALTARQNEVLQLLREGWSNKRIALRLHMCEATVKVHVRLIMRKFGVSNRTQVALCASGLRTAARASAPGETL
jgi:DNA-binding NarL/FixJ family response regulator